MSLVIGGVTVGSYLSTAATIAGLAQGAYGMVEGQKQKKKMKSDQKAEMAQPLLAEERAKKAQRNRMAQMASGGRQSTQGGMTATMG